VEAHIGSLAPVRALTRPDLLAAPVASALAALGDEVTGGVGVAEIDPEVADTAAFCERYGVSLAESANCVVISGKREGATRYAACVILATTRADVNNVARRELDVRKASFAAMDVAVAESGMEYGGITPIGVPEQWRLLVDARVPTTELVLIGSGIRGSKLILPGRLLAELPGAEVVEDLAV